MRGEAEAFIIRLSPQLRAKLRAMAVKAAVSENDIINILLIMADEEKIPEMVAYIYSHSRRRRWK